MNGKKSNKFFIESLEKYQERENSEKLLNGETVKFGTKLEPLNKSPKDNWWINAGERRKEERRKS